MTNDETVETVARAICSERLIEPDAIAYQSGKRIVKVSPTTNIIARTCDCRGFAQINFDLLACF